MSVIADPQALYGRLIDKGVDNALARALSDALHETPTGLATEASVNDLREEMRQLREETRLGFAATREEGIKTNARIDLLPNALLIRLGSLMVVLAGLIVTALRFWPAH